MRRGDVRAAVLVLLAEEANNGYGLMQEIENRSEGVWRPSPGSMYPVLAQLEDEALISAEETEGRKQYSLTEAGTAYVEENREKLGEPWAGLGDEVGEGRLELHSLLRQLAMAMTQVASAGTDAQIESARKILIDARKGLYRLLASDEDDE
jgi:DNA-binding PadR family transcriptional regulator